MRKYILATLITVIFVTYSFVLRRQHSEAVIAPASLSRTGSANSTTSSPNSSTSPNSSSTNSGSSTLSTNTSTNSTSTGSQYKDGVYNGSVENAFYGNVQVSATIQNGKITSVNFLQYPNENPNSIYVNGQAMPYLQQEAIKAQSSNVSIVTGATLTSQAFMQSLATALSQAIRS